MANRTLQVSYLGNAATDAACEAIAVPTSPEKSILLTALDMESEAERAAYLSEACGTDEELRASVGKLLQAHERADNPLDAPPAELEAEQSGEIAIDGTVDYSSSDARVGTIIGPYKLMEQIGEGGFGVVFVAEQQKPVKRRVALKIIKPGMDTRDVIARFEAERQAVAMMDHPNIARVFDAGVTDSGRPYFVMELVRGVPITEFCDKHELPARERLELFATVCRALQHAHQKGIIHRDLKPPNILVTLHDGVPVAKVIDFGVAKAIGQSLTEKTMYTRFTGMIGTPLYMSPEQAEMSGLDVDTRSDIYSLGVLLYELLTGSTPFDRERLQKAGLDELRRIIREEEPPRPSTRLTTRNQALSTVAAKRRLEPAKYPAIVRGDLDWIVMKAIEKDRSRRYETASALAEDVRRFLRQEPVQARPPSTLYRFRKFARRNKIAITTATLISTAMILGTGISVWQARLAVKARNEKDVALSDAVSARNDADLARKEVEQFAESLKQANLLLTSGRAHADAGRWNEAHENYTQATELQPNYYLLWLERGSLYVRLGLWKSAAADYAIAFDLNAPVDGASWWGVSQLFWHVDDKEHYAALCGKTLSANKASELSMNAIRSCLFGKRSAAEWQSLAGRAEALLNEDRQFSHEFDRKRHGNRPRERRGDGPPRRGGGPPRGRGGPPRRDDRNGGQPRGIGMPRGAGLYVAGWAQYRAGNLDEAIDWLEQSSTDRWPGQGIASPVLAMAYHRVGRIEEAKAELTATNNQLDRWTEELASKPLGTLPIPWFDWIEFIELHREATLLLTGILPRGDSRLTAFYERSLHELD